MSDILRLEGVEYTYRGADAPAATGVNLSLPRGATVGIVGESGSGKSTTLSMLLALAAPTAGRILFDGEPLDLRDRRQVRRLRRLVQPVFQDPYASLDPRMRVDRIVEEPLRSLGIERDRGRRRALVQEALAGVGLGEDALERYPHQFSGGQRQRIAIARALVTSPQLLVADEPVSALDVTTRIEVIALLGRLRRETGVGMVLVSHDMSIVAAMCDHLLVLKDGHVVEEGATLEVLHDPQHPYSRQLIAAIPRLPASEGR